MYGILEPGDGQPWATVYINGQFDSASQLPLATEVEYNVLWAGLSGLPLGEYEVVIKNEDAAPNSILWIDFFLIRDYEPLSGVTACGESASKVPPIAHGKRDRISVSSPPSTPSEVQHRKVEIVSLTCGAIIGALCGLVLALLVLRIPFFQNLAILAKSRRRADSVQSDNDPDALVASEEELRKMGR